MPARARALWTQTITHNFVDTKKGRKRTLERFFLLQYTSKTKNGDKAPKSSVADPKSGAFFKL
jgi:hypothetical protein